MKKLELLFRINWIKTIIFNFKYLKPQQAIKFPIFIYKHTKFQKLKGKIEIKAPINTGIIKIGPKTLGTKDINSPRTIWECCGTLIIYGKTTIGSGSSISIAKNATLTLGENFSITGNSSIICQKEISFGDGCLLSWDIQILDSDFHKIYNSEMEQINMPKPIVIGNKCWIGSRCTILKGIHINNNTIVASGSLITRSFSEQNVIIGGNGNQSYIIKEDIHWEP